MRRRFFFSQCQPRGWAEAGRGGGISSRGAIGSQQGVTGLVELVVVLGIILILAGLFVPSFFVSRDRATRENALQSLKALGTSLVMYRTEFSKYPGSGSVVGPLGKYTDVTRYQREFLQVTLTQYSGSTCVEAELADMREISPYYALYCPECKSELRCSADNRATWFDCVKGLSAPGVAAACP